MVPPSLAFLAATFWIIFGSVSETSSLAYAIVWPITVGLMVASVWWTLRKPPQAPWSDNIALPLSLIIQFGIGFAFLWLGSPSTQESTSISVSFSPFAMFCLLAVPWFFYFQDIYLWGEQRRGFKSYATPVYLAGFGILLLLFLLLWGGGSAWISIISGILIIGGVLLAVDQYFSERLQ